VADSLESAIEESRRYKLMDINKMCLNESCVAFEQVQAYICLIHFFIQNSVKRGDALSPLLFNFALDCAIEEGTRKLWGTGTEWNTSAFCLC
jgi:hypothetical protein